MTKVHDEGGLWLYHHTGILHYGYITVTLREVQTTVALYYVVVE